MSDLSLHIDCTYRWNDIKQFLASPNVHSAFLLNPSPEQVQYALVHCTFVVVRIYDPFNERNALGEDFEKSIVNRKVGASFVQWLDNSPFNQFKHDSRIRFELGWNELYSKRKHGERIQNENVVEIGQALVSAGYGVGLGGWAADKSFYADDVKAGHWDSVIKFAIDNPDFVSVDAHEYDVLTVFAGHLKSYPNGFPDTLKTAHALDPNNHTKIPYRRTEGDIESNYKIGRIALLLDRSYELHGKPFFWFRGECALDFKDDGALKPFIDNWYKPQFPHPNGINSLLPYYRHVLGDSFTEKQYDELIFRQHTDLVSQDPDSCQANFIFAWNGDRSHWLPFDVAQRPYFVSLVQNHKSEDTMTQPTNDYDFYDHPMADYKVHTTKSLWNIRKYPATSGADIGDMPTEPTPAKLSKDWVAQDGTYDWYKININGIKGFVAQFRGESTPNVFTPIVTDTPDEPDDTSTDNSELVARMDALEVTNQALNERITALENNLPQLMVSSLPEIIREINLHLPDHSTDIPTEWVGTLSNLARLFANLLDELVKPETVSAQAIKFPTVSEIADIGYAPSDNSDMFDDKGNITITNEVADDTNEQTLTDIMLNGDDSEDDDNEELDIAV